ncbi:hypothetical protein [Mucilaginibacter flavidus]|uniref:hypothetical protein n=1 Tax=Mucilaginibacter flavidus TaxID=2949309 RepID=UPI002091F1A5|nr:hypothetical protein [Mucilaginibacter flavidus]MCO5948035.1 hypothetical protein [Mucilaginibacter flavidus]
MYYFITFLFVLLAGKATFFDDVNACWFIIEGIILWVGLHKQRITKNDVQLFVKFALLYVGFCTFRSFFLTGLPIKYWLNDVVFLFKFILPSFLFCAVLKEKAVYYLTQVMIDLAILSLPLYCLQLISGDLVYNIGKAINLPYAHFNGYVNMFVFTYVKNHAIRNSGFSWEPGAFGFMLIMMLMLHWLNNNFKYDTRAKLVTIAIITTLSTTTYIAFAIMILIYCRAKGVRITTLLIFIAPFLCVAVVSLPFLFDKILDTYNKDMLDIKNIHTLSATYIEMGRVMPLNRFGSMLFLIDTFGNKLFFGVSNSYKETVQLLHNISISNGIFAFCAQFGVVGLGCLFYRAYKFFRKYITAELAIYCLIVILVLGFGECIYLSSLLLAFLFLYHYARPETTTEEVSENDTYEYATTERPAYNL